MGKNNTTKLQLGFTAKLQRIPITDIVVTKGIRISGFTSIINHLAAEYDAKGVMITNAETRELLAGYDEYEAATARHDKEVEVLAWDIPKNLSFGVLLLKHGKDFGWVNGYEHAAKAMEYFSFSEHGDGAALRRIIDTDDKSLPDFVAKLFGTNRTDLYRWLSIGDKKRFDLLRFVDAGSSTLKEAERIANQRQNVSPSDNETTGRKSPAGAVGRRFTKHDEITTTAQLTTTELTTITEGIPEVLTSLANLTDIPNDMLVERVFQHIPANERKKGNTVAKIDHIAVAGELPGFSFQITIHPENTDVSDTLVMKLPVTPPADDESTEEFAIAA